MLKAKDELKQVRYKFDKVNETLEEYEKYKARAEKMTAIISDATSRSNMPSDKVGDNAIIMADIKEKYKERYIEAEQERVKISQELDKIPEPYRTILYKIYVQGLSLTATANEMFFSYDSIAKKHRLALILYERRNKK